MCGRERQDGQRLRLWGQRCGEDDRLQQPLSQRAVVVGQSRTQNLISIVRLESLRKYEGGINSLFVHDHDPLTMLQTGNPVPGTGCLSTSRLCQRHPRRMRFRVRVAGGRSTRRPRSGSNIALAPDRGPGVGNESKQGVWDSTLQVFRMEGTRRAGQREKLGRSQANHATASASDLLNPLFQSQPLGASAALSLPGRRLHRHVAAAHGCISAIAARQQDQRAYRKVPR